MPVIDLKFTDPCSNSSESFQRGSKNEYRQNRLCSSSQPITHSPFAPVHLPLSWQPQGQAFQLLRPIPVHGIRSTHFSGKFARYRSLSSGSKKQTLPYGYSWWHIQKYAGKCQQSSRLAYLCRFRSSPYQQGTGTLQKRRFRCRSRRNCLCARFLHNRSEFIDISLGAFPVNKSGSQVAYLVGLARQHSYIPPYQRRQIARCQYIRRTHSRAGQFLYHGSRLSGLCQAVSNRSMECLLRYQSKIKFQVLSDSFSSDRQEHRPSMRSDGQTGRLLLCPILPGKDSPYKVLRLHNRKNSGILMQQLFSASTCNSRPLSMPMASGTILQMDKATSTNQVIFRYVGECCQKPNMDSSISIRYRRNHKKAVWN